MVQGELFREENSGFGTSSFETSRRKSFLTRHQMILTLDKLLLVSIALMVGFVLTYSFGVECGKRNIEKQIQALLPSHSEIVSTGDEIMEPSEGTANEAVLVVGEGDAKRAQKTLIQPPPQTLF